MEKYAMYWQAYYNEKGFTTKARVYIPGGHSEEGLTPDEYIEKERIMPRPKEIRERVRRHYTVVKFKSGKTRIVARIPKGKIGAGRFTKR